MSLDHERDFELDAFQRDAIEAFDAGDSVLVAAPTGSGKTVIAEHGIAVTLASGRDTFYTSPIKALANQKYRDFGERFGPANVGLLTGDVTVNGNAPIVVMTTEVLRNMLYERAPRLRRLGCVVLDEVHYLQDRERGPVWEEVLLNLPADVRTVSLSATVSNLDEFVAWLRSVRGPTTLILETERPVPLEHRLAVGDREERRTHLVPLLDGVRVSDEAYRFARNSAGSKGQKNRGRDRRDRDRRDRGGRGARSGRPKRRWVPPRRTRLVPRLLNEDLGPLIWFIFSRAGCDEAVDQCPQAGLRYTDRAERARLREILEDRTADLDDDSWYGLELDHWQRAFEAGIASHHAGLIPSVKEAVEVAFAEGLISVVFATETLALGVNLPARTVVLERLVKYDGEDHKPLTPMQFTQLTGRAGRRGLDDAGTAVSCWNARLGVKEMAALASSQEFPLRSAFAPNYNMVANLIRRSDQDNARRFVARSFAQFQIDQTAVESDTRNLGLEQQLAQARRATTCDRGDVEEWLRSQRGGATADDDELGQLRPGSVLGTHGGAIVTSLAHRKVGIILKAVTRHGDQLTLRAGELPSPVPVLGVAQLPTGQSPSDPATIEWVARELNEHWRIEEHGVGGCPRLDEHLAALREVDLIEGRLSKTRARQARRAGRLERRFDAVADILHETGFADGWELTPKGELLTAVHGETEIVLAEALHDGLFTKLEPPGFAAVISALVHESRRGDPESFRWPGQQVKRTVSEIRMRASKFRALELQRLDDTLTREPDPALIGVVHGWATGKSLDEVLPETMTGGDFVRGMRQVIDVCRQISQTDTAVAELASEAIFCIDHGVVRSRRDLFREHEQLAEDDDAD